MGETCMGIEALERCASGHSFVAGPTPKILALFIKLHERACCKMSRGPKAGSTGPLHLMLLPKFQQGY